MSNVTLFKQLENELKATFEELKEAEKNSNSCMANGDFNTAAYWDREYCKLWNKYTDLVIEINKIPED